MAKKKNRSGNDTPDNMIKDFPEKAAGGTAEQEPEKESSEGESELPVSAEKKVDEKENKEKDKPKTDLAKLKKKKMGSVFLGRIKELLRMFLKLIVIFFIFIAGLLILGSIILAIVNGIKKNNEKQYLTMKGTQVEVDGRYLHVVTGGKEDAEATLIFIHGNRTADESVVLEPLWQEIESSVRYFYVDRSGFGYSDGVDDDRDVDALLEETRKAAEKAGMKAPYILVPESTGGLIALHWAARYPEEVSAIFGIGMTYPEQFEGMEEGEYAGFGDWLTKMIFKIGAARLFSGMEPTDPAGIYTEDQMNTRSALIYKGAYTDEMYREDKAMVRSALMVLKEGWPTEIPIYLIHGNPLKEPYINLDENTKAELDQAKEEYPDVDIPAIYYTEQRDFFEGKKNVTFAETDGPVRLAVYAPKEIGAQLLNFVKTAVLKQN